MQPAPRIATASVARRDTEPGTLVDELRAVQGAMMDAAVGDGDLDTVARLAAEAINGSVAIMIPGWGATITSDACRPADVEAVRAWVEERTRGRPATVPAGVVAEVPIRARGELVGMVVLFEAAPAATRFPHAIAFLHAAATAALTVVAIEDAREQTTRRLRGSLLEDLRDRSGLTGAELVRRAARLGCDLSAGAVILCAELKEDRARLVATTICSEYPGALAEPLDSDGTRPARVYSTLPADNAGAPATLARARRLAARLERQAHVGLSTFRADPAELADALREAELVLDVLRHSAAPIGDELASETYRLLFRLVASHPEEVASFHRATVAPLAHYDDQYQTELVQTLQAYLDANCNMNATAAAIYAHRHTVAYRLERVRELTGLDPMLSEDRERLGLGLKVQRIVGADVRR